MHGAQRSAPGLASPPALRARACLLAGLLVARKAHRTLHHLAIAFAGQPHLQGVRQGQGAWAGGTGEGQRFLPTCSVGCTVNLPAHCPLAVLPQHLWLRATHNALGRSATGSSPQSPLSRRRRHPAPAATPDLCTHLHTKATLSALLLQVPNHLNTAIEERMRFWRRGQQQPVPAPGTAAAPPCRRRACRLSRVAYSFITPRAVVSTRCSSLKRRIRRSTAGYACIPSCMVAGSAAVAVRAVTTSACAAPAAACLSAAASSLAPPRLRLRLPSRPPSMGAPGGRPLAWRKSSF